MIYQKATEQVQNFIQNFYSESLNTGRIYHNLQYSQELVNRATEIAGHYQIEPKRLFVIQTAAWFNTLCYHENPDSYYKRSARIADKFLRKISAPQEVIKGVTEAILVTRIPQQPKDLVEQIVCDAHMYYLGLDDFENRSRLIRKELELITGKKISKEEWRLRNIQLLQNHRFKTDHARALLEEQQKRNLAQLLDPARPSIANEKPEFANRGSNKKSEESGNLSLNPSSKQKAEKKDQSSQEKKLRPERGIETMFRISANNHQALSEMADSKAHILITVNSIIISVLLSVLFRSLDNEPHLALPVAILLIVNVVTIIFSILATRPNIPSGKFTQEDLVRKRVNLLFFGNYHRMKLEDFSDGMTQLMDDRDFLYGSMIKNLHSQGIVLGKKYKLLRTAYNVFMYGLVVSILAFATAIFIKQG